jgi:hypothetical protein
MIIIIYELDADAAQIGRIAVATVAAPSHGNERRQVN